MDKDWIFKFNEGIRKLHDTILEKKFKISNEKGYDPEDVDAFYDEVNGYIEEVRKLVENKYIENIKFKNENEQLKNEINDWTSTNKKLRSDIEMLKKSGYGHYADAKLNNEKDADSTNEK
jgi:DivIVA domain-containing protein